MPITRLAQLSLLVLDQTAALYRPEPHRLSAISYRHSRFYVFELWSECTGKLSG